ncbi:MAG: zinc D-Ala-D-Ala carboxypeptidase, partial [Mycobacterium sp.]|nr:zinc D-Ala-D-Ala carboxypeptidase [Mycobacterium sp.]
MRSVALAAAAAGAVGFLTAVDPDPPITLVDHAVPLDPASDPGDGSLSGGRTLTPFDVQNPAIGRLDPALLNAIQSAATAAGDQRITMTITSGWRSPQFQQRLLDDAVQTYGSLAAARQYVQTPGMS